MDSLISIATWNVNSVRARLCNIIEWLSCYNPTVLLMQEIKCQDDFFPTIDFTCMGYNYLVSGQKSYNGVAILSKIPIELTLNVLPCADADFQHDSEARYLEAMFTVSEKVFRIASLYVPNGSSILQKNERLENSKRFRYKLDFLSRLHKRMNDILTHDEYFILGGDYNVAHNDIDLFNPEKARGAVGFHDDEREHFSKLLQCGVVDLFRTKYPDRQEYSWWDYRRSGWEMNKGWRIDYLLGSRNVKNIMSDCVIHAEQRGAKRASDHVPVLATFVL